MNINKKQVLYCYCNKKIHGIQFIAGLNQYVVKNTYQPMFIISERNAKHLPA